MANRSTRNKIRFQGESAFADLKKAQNHLVQLAALADERSTFINDNLPQIVAGVESVTTVVDEFSQRL